MESAAITGIGILSSLGLDDDEFNRGLFSGVQAGGPLTLFEMPSAPRVAEVIDFEIEDYLDTVKSYIDRTSSFVLAACTMAMAQAEWEIEGDDAYRAGICMGTAWGCMDSLELYADKYIHSGPTLVPPLIFTHSYANAPSGIASIQFNLKGFNACFSGGHSVGLQAVSYGSDQVRLGRVDYLLAGGADSLSHFVLSGNQAQRKLASASRPFDPATGGFLPSEGAAVFALEPASQAGPRAKAFLAGTASARHSHRAPGCEIVMRQALAEADTQIEDIAFVVASANGLTETDQAEAEALLALSSGLSAPLPIFAAKTFMGEPMAAGGPLSIAAAVAILQARELPGQPERTGPACATICQPRDATKLDKTSALVNSFSPSGEACSLVIQVPQ